MIESMERVGARGAGQSSWGPTLFAVQECQADALDLATRLSEIYPPEENDVWIASPDNQGAALRRG